ncbi:MAG: gliding motility protein GldC [Cytophagales bacterium]|nr:MAG: gliding motility protein GldC [Cytophagales bacterium]
MRKSNIELNISLDDQNVPELITWNASESPTGKPESTAAFALAIWDANNHSTMKIDLWTKDMPMDEMKLFYIEAIGGMSESLLSATSDEYMYKEIKSLCEKLMLHLDNEFKKS